MNDLEKLSQLVEAYTRRTDCTFYRDLYGMKPEVGARRIASWDEWRALPLFCKDDLVRTPMSTRSYEPLSEAHSLSVSSGTSGKPPVFTARTGAMGSSAYRLEYHDFKAPHLYCATANAHREELSLAEVGCSPKIIAIDPSAISASVRLGAALGFQSMHIQSQFVPSITKAANGPNENVRLVELTGAAAPLSHIRMLAATFPRAVITSEYGLTESGINPIAVSCRPMTVEQPDALMHASETAYIELVDPATGAHVEPVAGAEGEVVVTTLSNAWQSLPLIRYRSGDMARVVEDACAKHSRFAFVFTGRAASDFVKIPGGMLRADEIERVLRLHDTSVSDEFELKVREASGIVEARLFVDARASVDLGSLARLIQKDLRIGPNTTYEEAVIRGACQPLVCEPLSPQDGAGKRRRITLL